jgi:hypothetical protein
MLPQRRFHPKERFRLNLGAGGGIRSPALLITDQPLSHLSYTSLERAAGIEPAHPRRQRSALPLSYARSNLLRMTAVLVDN